MTYLPLVDSEGRMLPIHFLTEQEVQYHESTSITLQQCSHDGHVTYLPLVDTALLHRTRGTEIIEILLQ